MGQVVELFGRLERSVMMMMTMMKVLAGSSTWTLKATPRLLQGVELVLAARRCSTH